MGKTLKVHGKTVYRQSFYSWSAINNRRQVIWYWLADLFCDNLGHEEVDYIHWELAQSDIAW